MDASSTGSASLYDALLTQLPNLLGQTSEHSKPEDLAGFGRRHCADVLSIARRALGKQEKWQSPQPAISNDADSPLPKPVERAIPSPRPQPRPIEDASTAFTVHLLDGFQVSIGIDLAVDLPHGKTRSLFKMLLLHRRGPMSRAKLGAALWPEADPASARNSLNVALHRLRRALGHAGLVRHEDAGYRLTVTDSFWLDAEQFLMHAAMGSLEEGEGRAARAIGEYELAVALYRTDLFEDGGHEPALAADAQALHDRLNQVLERLATLREEMGDLHGCLRAAHRHLALDDCNEVAHRRLMRCYAHLGQPQLAERQYRSCVSALRARLGINPQPQTTELCRQIGRHVPV